MKNKLLLFIRLLLTKNNLFNFGGGNPPAVFLITMNKKLLILSSLFVLCMLFGSCSKKHEVQVVQTYSFHTGIVDVSFRYVGYYSNDGNDGLYFIDKNRFIKTFDLSGKMLDSIPLNNIINELALKRDKIKGEVKFAGKDFIWLDSDYKNYVSMIDRGGTVKKIIQIDSLLNDSVKNFNSYSFSLPNANEQDFDIFSARYNAIKTEEKFKILTFEYYEDYYNTLFKHNYFLQIKNITDPQPEINFLAKDYLQSVSNQPFVNHSSDQYKILNGNMFIINGNNTSIIQLWGDNFQNKKIIKIQSEHIDNKVFTPSVKEVFSDFNTTQKQYKEFESKYYRRGTVQNIFYNSKQQKYYITAGHSLNSDEELEKYGYDLRPFSVILYDKNFENSVEYTFEPNIYKCRNAIMTSKGLLMERKQHNINIDNYGTQTFDLLDFK